LNAVGIPVIDLIDFRFSYWHTADDTIDNSARRVFRLLVQWPFIISRIRVQMNRVVLTFSIAVAILGGVFCAELTARSIPFRDKLADVFGRGHLLAVRPRPRHI